MGNPLEDYVDSQTSGPRIWKWRHYFEIYHRHFEKFRGQEVHVVEIGVHHGGSLAMWKHYFGRRCRIYGVDIEPACRVYEDEQTEIFIGDQADELFWARFVEQVPRIDVVIDDGGHLPEQQTTTLEALLPHISPGGVYLCEDLHGRRNPFHAYVTNLARKLNSWGTSDAGLRRTPSDFQQMVQSIHLYPFVAVIERRSEALTELHASRHETGGTL